MAVPVLVCGDCGAKLSHNDVTCPQCGAVVEHQGAPGHVGKTPQASRSRRSFKFELWHVAAGIILVGVLAVFVYQEITRVQPGQQQHVHGNVPEETAAMLREIERLEQAVRNNPDDKGSVLRLANLLHDNSMNDPRLLVRAVDAYRKYLTLNPSDPDARVDLGICYFEMSRVDSTQRAELLGMAIVEMESVHNAVPSHQAATFNLGIVNLFGGNADASTSWFRKTVDLDANSELGRRAQRLLEQHAFQSPVN